MLYLVQEVGYRPLGSLGHTNRSRHPRLWRGIVSGHQKLCWHLLHQQVWEAMHNWVHRTRQLCKVQAARHLFVGRCCRVVCCCCQSPGSLLHLLQERCFLTRLLELAQPFPFTLYLLGNLLFYPKTLKRKTKNLQPIWLCSDLTASSLFGDEALYTCPSETEGSIEYLRVLL